MDELYSYGDFTAKCTAPGTSLEFQTIVIASTFFHKAN